MANQRRENLTRQELENLLMFEGVEPKYVLGPLENCPIICLARDEVVISQGETNNKCYFILTGQLRVHLDSLASEIVSVLHAGESVGEMSLLDGKNASAHVVCHTTCELLVLNENVFWSLVNASHNFSRNLLFVMTSRLRGNNVYVSANLKKQREYKLDATIDELTGLYNRRWLNKIMVRQMKRSQHNDEPLSILMVDVDHFKKVNDDYGHIVGDQVLRSIARTMVDHVRPTDLLARFGGEEFIAILQASNLTAARGAAKRMCRSISAVQVVTAEGVILPTITISIGIAEMRTDESMDEFIMRADAALYQAKQNGRDQVEG